MLYVAEMISYKLLCLWKCVVKIKQDLLKENVSKV